MEGGGGGGGVGGGGRGGEREDGGVRRESVDADFAEAGGGGRVDAGEGWGFGRRGREFESEGFHNEANEGARIHDSDTTNLLREHLPFWTTNMAVGFASGLKTPSSFFFSLFAAKSLYHTN